MVKKQEVKGKSKRVKKYHILLLVLFLFLLGGIVVQHRYGTKSKLHRKIEEFRAAGYPVSLKELDKLYSIPEGAENAADLIMDAISDYNEPNDSSVLDIAGGINPRPLPEEIIKSATTYLKNNQKSLELLHKAGVLKFFRYPANISAGQTPKLFNIQKMVKLLCVDAVINAENGDSEAAAKSLLNSFSIVNSLSDVPFSIGQHCRMVYLEDSILSLEHIINTIDYNDEQLAQLFKTMADKQRLSGISYGFTGELCQAISQFEDIMASNEPFRDLSFSQRLFYSVYKSVGLIESDCVIYLDILDKYIKAGKLPLEKRLDADKQIKNETSNISRIHVELKGAFTLYSRFFSDELVSISRLRTALAALAIQRYRLKNNKLPDSLSNLVPEYLDSVPSDPFNGKELRYKKLDSGFVVHSVDQDLIDDGGQEEPKKRQQKVLRYDITFTIKK
ncbi:MAG: hypothetical protein JW787_12120 [Sedimentisphaerales bacterium]|nr:hypothetical protein [Sedimentisphaerales bacterium]